MFVFSFSIFALSGFTIATMLLAKTFEVKGNKKFFLLKAISMADERMRALRHRVLHFYSEGKHKTGFIIKKQLPLKAKNYWNKAVSFTKEQSERIINKRGAREISKPENISEFFRSIAEVEKGNGEIHEPVFMVNDLGIEVQKTALEIVETPKPKRKYTRRKVKVVEVE